MRSIAERKELMQKLCVKMLGRLADLGISASGDMQFVAEFDGRYIETPQNHLRCLLKADFKNTDHGLDNRDFREVVDRTLQSLLHVVKEEIDKGNSPLVREVTIE